jgi:dolichyl-diphosphooligosaccharide--protein glycosyltransferase
MIISIVTKVINPSNPNAAVDVVCYYLPPVLGILCVIGIFLVGVLLFNAWAGLVAALLLATMGGEFMARSIAGSADYHVLEVFLLISFILCVVASVKWHDLKRGAPSFLLAILAGLITAVYMKSWYGAIYLYMILLATYVLYLIFLSVKAEAPSGTLFGIPCIVISSTVLFYIILSQLTNTSVNNMILILSAVCLAIIIVLTVIHALFVSKGNKWGFIVSVLVLAICGTIALSIAYRSSYYGNIMSVVRPILSWSVTTHTSEERPILLFGNEFSLKVLWGNFTVGIFLCLIGIGILIKKMLSSDRHTLFNYILIIVGALAMLIGTLAMVRFAYYLAVYVACLSGIVVYLIVDVSTSYLKRNAKKMRWYDKAGDLLLIFFMLVMVFVPNFMMSNQFSNPLEGSLTGGWEQAMTWLKGNSPEPFDDANYYYADYKNNVKEPSYSVMSWWDYGYWITYVAHRVPTCNPGSASRDVPAIFLTLTNVDSANKVLQASKSRYIVVDYQTATGKFTALPSYAEISENIELKALWDKETHDYIGVYNIGEGDKLQRMTIFYPAYYKSMVARLYNFNGQAVKSPGCPVIIYKEINGQKWIQKIIDTPSHQEALDYASKNPLTDGSLYTFGGTDPFLSCVDLSEVKDIRPLKGFGGVDLSFMSQTVKQGYEVKVFEYTGGF